MVSTIIQSNTLLLLIAISTYLSCEVESFSLHQSSSAATRDVATTIQSQQIRPSSTSLFMSDAALSLTGQEGACTQSFRRVIHVSDDWRLQMCTCFLVSIIIFICNLSYILFFHNSNPNAKNDATNNVRRRRGRRMGRRGI